MLLFTLRHYVEGIGGKLELVAHFPNRQKVVIERLGMDADTGGKTRYGLSWQP